MKMPPSICRAAALLISATALAQEASITTHTDRAGPTLSHYMTGACIEDVNHEIYGGLYSQMIFGESFQEPAPMPAIAGFKAFGGTWTCADDELRFSGAAGDKLVSDLPAFGDGQVGLEIFMADRNWSNVGLVVRVGRAAARRQTVH